MGLSEEQHVYVCGLEASTFLGYFCGKPCLWWSPLVPPHLAYLSSVEGVNDIRLRKQSGKNALGNLRKRCPWVFSSVFFLCKLGEGKRDICDQPLIRKTKSNGRLRENIWFWLKESWYLKSLRLSAIESAPCSNLHSSKTKLSIETQQSRKVKKDYWFLLCSVLFSLCLYLPLVGIYIIPNSW